MHAKNVLSLHRASRLRRAGRSSFLLRTPEASIRFSQLPSGVAKALWRLRGLGASSESLIASVLRVGGAEALSHWYAVLHELANHGALTRAVTNGTHILVRANVVARHVLDADESIRTDRSYVLSRFAFMRREGGHLVVTSPLSQCRVELCDPAVLAVILALSRPVGLRALARMEKRCSKSDIRSVLSLLLAARIVMRSDRATDDEMPAMAWEFADALLHSHSRLDAPLRRVGARYPLLGRVAPLPALKASMSEHVIPLRRVDVQFLEQRDKSFTQVLEGRRSIRSAGKTPLTLDQLGEFLFRAARVKRCISIDDDATSYEKTRRPYAGGGACYELDIYPVVRDCLGLDRGTYHYDPRKHALEKLDVATGVAERLLRDAVAATGRSFNPQVLIVITARFARVSWKYSGMAYVTMMKDVGALFQTFYLVATAMSLAPCAVGAGDSDLFALAIAEHPFTESSVGEFLLGSAPLKKRH